MDYCRFLPLLSSVPLLPLFGGLFTAHLGVSYVSNCSLDSINLLFPSNSCVGLFPSNMFLVLPLLACLDLLRPSVVLQKMCLSSLPNTYTVPLSDFPVTCVFLTSGLIPLWSRGRHHMIPFLSNLLMWFYSPERDLSLRMLSVSWRRMCIPLCWIKVTCRCQLGPVG